jgi:uncharacterized protein YodC (DUF2158 family)
MEFKEGDIVALKSGGPPMTIESLEKYATGSIYAFCTWFDASGKHTEQFNTMALEKAKR